MCHGHVAHPSELQPGRTRHRDPEQGPQPRDHRVGAARDPGGRWSPGPSAQPSAPRPPRSARPWAQRSRRPSVVASLPRPLGRTRGARIPSASNGTDSARPAVGGVSSRHSLNSCPAGRPPPLSASACNGTRTARGRLNIAPLNQSMEITMTGPSTRVSGRPSTSPPSPVVTAEYTVRNHPRTHGTTKAVVLRTASVLFEAQSILRPPPAQSCHHWGDTHVFAVDEDPRPGRMRLDPHLLRRKGPQDRGTTARSHQQHCDGEPARNPRSSSHRCGGARAPVGPGGSADDAATAHAARQRRCAGRAGFRAGRCAG